MLMRTEPVWAAITLRKLRYVQYGYRILYYIIHTHSSSTVVYLVAPSCLPSYPTSPSTKQKISQTQTEILTQNPDLTQLGDFEGDCELSPLPPYSPAAQQTLPWGRMVPCSKYGAKGVDLLPRTPEHANEQARRKDGGVGVTCLGMDHLLPSDIFNEYLLGRSNKCDVLAVKPPLGDDKREKALQDWAFGMISNKHCRIYCSLDSSKPAGANGTQGLQVYVEDSSGNGTLINKTTLLRRGEKRLLHSGDEVCFVNPQTLRKKIRSNAVLQELLQHYSFVFINVFQQHQAGFPSLHATVTGRPRLSSSSFSSSGGKRRGAVDVRSLNHKSLTANNSRSQDESASRSLRRKSTESRRISPRRQQPRRIEEEYDIRDLLGSGTVGEVRRAIHRQTGQERAVKVIALGGRNRATNFLEANATFEAEAAILQGLEHPYVVKLIDVYVSPAAVYLVMELLHGGDLFDRIIQKGKYSELQGRRIMRRLLAAVYYLHEERNIVHRDLKPENILCVDHESDVDVKITDFGLAKAVNGEDGLKTFCGTPQYFAPEVLRRRHTVAGRGRYGKQADMWSLGVVLYVLLSGTPPFDVGQGFDIVGDAKIKFPEEHWAEVSEQARDLVRKLLVTDPRKRISVLEACKHVWVMTEDGDTHVYPLDDPKLAVSKKRLFPVKATAGDETASQPLDADKVDEVVPSDASAPLVANASPDAATANGHKLNISVEEIQPCWSPLTAPVDFSERLALSPLSLNGKRSTKPDPSDTPVDTLQFESSLLEEDKEHAKGLPKVCNPPVDKIPSNSFLDLNTTPGASNKSQAGVNAEQARIIPGFPNAAEAELSDDEICSQFSERTESISGFSGSDEGFAEAAEPSAVASGDSSSMDKPAVFENTAVSFDQKGPGSNTDGQSKKRRVTDVADDHMSTMEPSKTLKTKNSGSVRSQDAGIGSPDVASPTGYSAKIEGKGNNVMQKKNVGGKQTTLSDWFKKPSS